MTKPIERTDNPRCIGYQRNTDRLEFNSVYEATATFADGTQATVWCVLLANGARGAWSDMKPRVDVSNE